MALKLTMTCGPYDRARALIDGTVKPEGIDLEVCVNADDADRQRRGRALEFDACEFFTLTYVADLPYRSLGLTAIPIFVKRMFRHSSIYVNTRAGIRAPADLNGRRIGIQAWCTSEALWGRAILIEAYGLAPKAVTWVEAVVLDQDGASPQRRAGEPRLDADAAAVQVGGRADAGARVHVDRRVAEHALHEDGDGREAERAIGQVGDIGEREELAGVELQGAAAALAVGVVGVDAHLQVDALGLHRAVDERAGAIVRPASHGQLQRHRRPPARAAGASSLSFALARGGPL